VERLVIVGASLAGLRAAQAARAAGFEGELVVVGEEQRLPYQRPPLSKGLLAGEEDVTACMLPGTDAKGLTPCSDAKGLTPCTDWRLGERAESLDLDARQVRLADGDALSYDRLIVTTGCRARPWPGPGADLDGVFTVRTLEDSLALRAALEGQSRLVIVGAGFIGCEAAASARKLGVDVTLVDVAPTPMPGLGRLIGERCADMHRAHGVDLRLGTGISALHGDGGRVTHVELEGGERIEAGVVLVALGAIPNTDWLEGSGLRVERGGVLCDATLAAAEDVFCAGDIAAWPHPLSPGDPIRVEHWTNAAEQGTHAGRNAVAPADERKPYVAVPSFWSDQYDVKIQAVGFPRLAERVQIAEASPEGERFVAVGERDGRIVAALGWNGARRLPLYRRHIAQEAAAQDVLRAIGDDPKAFGAPAAVSA
jgi:NADPH-dependent 2,4-dienoyl-CoA reductase/sulfur reductase-like enzyme